MATDGKAGGGPIPPGPPGTPEAHVAAGLDASTGGASGRLSETRAAPPDAPRLMASDAGGPGFDFYARLVADNCKDPIVVTGADGRVEWVNTAFVACTGYALSEIHGRIPGKILQGAETDPDCVREIGRALAARCPIRTEILNYTKSGAPYWIEIDISPVFSPDGRHTHFIATQRDITERRELEQRTRSVVETEEYRQSERRLLAEMSEWLYSAKALPELMSVVELSMSTLMPEAEGALYVYSDDRDSLRRAVQWGGMDAPEHVSPDECWSLMRGRAYFYGSQAIQLTCSHAHGHALGEHHPHFCLPITAQSETIGLLHLSFSAFSLKRPGDAAVHDAFLSQRWRTAITCAEQISLAVANVRLRNELETRSIRDQLTGLRNRRWFMEEGTRLARQALGRDAPLSMIALDVDHFKRFNDTFGHDAGDAVLEAVGDALSGFFPDPAAPCRIGGEEFGVLLPGVSGDAAVMRAEELRGRLAGLRLAHEGTQLPAITVSAGVATAPDDGATVRALLKSADRALYAAKNAGRDIVKRTADVPTAECPSSPPSASRPDMSPHASAKRGPGQASGSVDRSDRRALPNGAAAADLPGNAGKGSRNANAP